MLSDNKAKLVKKCYLVPKIARYSLLSLFPTGAAAILLVMIDNIALGSNGLGNLQLIAISSIMIAEGILTIACGLSAKATLRSERWRAIERETHGGPVCPDSASGLNVFALMDLLGSSAAAIAHKQGIAAKAGPRRSSRLSRAHLAARPRVYPALHRLGGTGVLRAKQRSPDPFRIPRRSEVRRLLRHGRRPP